MFFFCCCGYILKDGTIIPCKKNTQAIRVARLFFSEIVRLHDVLKSIMFDRDINFLSNFWLTLWKIFYSSLKFSNTTYL